MKFKKDELGTRIKSNYEDRTRYLLPRRTYTMIRLDGKAFHTFVRGLDKPFDNGLIEDMDKTAIYLSENIQGAKFAFVQSDEISILLTDFEKITTDLWFDGNIQKMASISAAIATSKFNQLRTVRYLNNKFNEGVTNITPLFIENILKQKLAQFDSRVFTITSKTEVFNTILWRQQDTVRNSISSVAQSLYSHKQLENKNTSEMQEMCFQKGVNWNNIDPKLKRGRFIYKTTYDKNGTLRSKWESIECPIFSQDKNWLLDKIPNLD